MAQTAWCAVRVKGAHLRAFVGRLKASRSLRKAITTVAASVLTAAYWMLRRGVVHAELGDRHFDRAGRVRRAACLARKLDELGFDVTLTQREAA